MIKYSLVIPIYKDAALADAFCAEFEKVFRKYLGTDAIHDSVEAIFVNDGSGDNAAAILKEICQRYRFAKAIDLSRNFGQHVALACGYRHAGGEYVGSLNVDMEDPPDQIPVILEEFKKGDYDIVHGVRPERHSPWLVKITSVLFHWLLNKLTGYKIPLNLATLRIMNRRFTDAYCSLQEKSPFLPALESWIGFKRAYVPITHRLRKVGQSSYNFRRRFVMALDSLISFSDLPLRFMVVFGTIIAVAGFLSILLIIFEKLFFHEFQAGWPSTIAIIVFLGGIQILVTGLASLYIGRILKEVQNRPLYIVREKYNFP